MCVTGELREVGLGWHLGKLVSLAVSPLHCDSDRMETSFILSLQLFQLNVHLMSAQCQHPQKKSVFAFFSIENICLYTGMIRISDTMFSVVLWFNQTSSSRCNWHTVFLYQSCMSSLYLQTKFVYSIYSKCPANTMTTPHWCHVSWGQDEKKYFKKKFRAQEIIKNRQWLYYPLVDNH